MKKSILSLFSLAALSLGASAQVESRSSVFIIGDGTADEIVKTEVIEYFRRTHEPGFQQPGMPRFMITDKSKRAIFSIGGFINFRTAYDFNRVMPSLDFIPYDLSTASNGLNAERVLMDASTSRIYFKTVLATKSGPLVGYIDADFRGPGNAFRLRDAYVSYAGFTLGQTVSTFTDLSASFNTIDFQGPNGYTYGRNLMVRYKHAWNNGISAAIALEYPVVSGTYGERTQAVYQRIPDIPAYIQYSWDGGASHIRASGILRNMYYYNNIHNDVQSSIGWGAQLSGTYRLCHAVQLYGDIVYGTGITPYVADLQGSGLDLVPDRRDQNNMLTTTSLSWLLGAQVNITPKMPVTLGYSQVTVLDPDHNSAPTAYRTGQYIVSNLFYNFSSALSLGVEYLHGIRTNFNGSHGGANRIQACVQLSF